VYLLDTDSISNAWTKNRNYPRLRAKIVEELPHLYLSIISVSEFLRLLQQNVRRQWNADESTKGYQDLYTFLTDLRNYNLLPFTHADEQRYRAFPAELRRSHPRDCRIAASAMTRGFQVVTYNVQDFRRIGAEVTTWAEADDAEELPDWYRPEEESPW
jgi:predicted nucleic acid-binding protein